MTEMQLADGFQKMLTQQTLSLPKTPAFEAVFREVLCKQGIADFVGVVAHEKSPHTARRGGLPPECSLASSSTVLGVLSLAKQPISVSYVVAQSGLSSRTAMNALESLLQHRLVGQSRQGLYELPENPEPIWPDMWAFELKLSNWRRAAYQALQYGGFASHAVVVMPISKYEVAQANKATFAKLGIGLLLLDLDTCGTKLLVPARRIGPVSSVHALFAAGRLATMPRLQHGTGFVPH